MRVFQWVGLEIKRLLRNRFATLAAIVILLIPLLYSFLYLYSFWDPYGHLERIRVAVVNQDQAAKSNDQIVNAGQDLVKKLKEDHTVGWNFTNPQDAFDGLNRSKYDLVIVIPKDFSQSIVNATKDPQTKSELPKSKILYYSDPSKNYLTEQIGNKVVSNLQGEMNSQITGNFFENVFGNLTDMKTNLKSAADGSDELEAGIEKAYSGSSNITEHLHDAATGSDTLNLGLKSLSEGSAQVAQGNAGLAEGSTKLYDGSKTIQSGVNKAYDGSTQLGSGSDSLVKGLIEANQSIQDAASGSAELHSGLASAYEGSQKLQKGLADAVAGSGQLKDGADQLQTGLKTMKVQLNSTDSDPAKAGVPVLIQGADQIVAATSEPSYTPDNPQTITNGVKAAGDGIKQISGGLNTAVPALSDANMALLDAKAQMDKVLAANPSLNSDPSFMTAYNEVLQVQQGIQNQVPALSGAIIGLNQIQYGLTGQSSDPLHPTVLDGLRSLNFGSTQLKGGLQNLLSQSNLGLDQLISGALTLSAGAMDLNSGLTSAYSGSSNLTQGLYDLREGGAKLSSGLASGAASFPKLVDGGKSLQEGINQLKQGLEDLSQGMIAFVEKLGDLMKGAIQLADGSKSLNDGTAQAMNGSVSLRDGLMALHDGSSALTGGLSQVQTGSQQLSSGLKEGVDSLQKELPQDTALVSKTMGQPVEINETQIHPVKNYGTGFAPYFIPLSLWVGALMIFFLINLKETSLQVAGVSKVRILLGKYATIALLSAAQAVISSFVLIEFLGLCPENALQFYGFNILQSLAYVAIMFLLIELFDMAGRFIAIVLLMLQLTSGGGTYPVTLSPEFFQAIHSYLPMTYGISALRSIISGSSDIPLQTSVAVLCGFGAGAILLTILLSPKQLRIKDLHPAPQLGE